MPRLYYITTKTKEEVKKIARKLLQENCIAGANIFPILVGGGNLRGRGIRPCHAKRERKFRKNRRMGENIA